MCLPYFDKTILNLLTILIAGAGLFAVLTKFDVPQLRMSFFGENPYTIKRDVIDKIMTRIFSGLALFGLLIQTYSLIFAHQLSERIYNTSSYVIFFLVGFGIMIGVLYSLGILGKCIARRIWLPEIVQKQSESFQVAGEIIKNGGYRNDDLANIEHRTNDQKRNLMEKHYKHCDEILARIEDLIDIRDLSKTRDEKYRNLEKYFKNIGS